MKHKKVKHSKLVRTLLNREKKLIESAIREKKPLSETKLIKIRSRLNNLSNQIKKNK